MRFFLAEENCIAVPIKNISLIWIKTNNPESFSVMVSTPNCSPFQHKTFVAKDEAAACVREIMAELNANPTVSLD